MRMRKSKQRKQRRAGSKSDRTPSALRKHAGPQNLAEYLAKSDRFKETWNRAEHVVSKMRSDKLSLQAASRDFQINPRTVIRLAGSALQKGANGKYRPRPDDRLLRVLVLPFSDGLHEIAVRSSLQASVTGEYWAAVQKYLATGDESALKRIRRKTITEAGGKRIRLLKDIADLERLASAGVLSFESLYAKVA